MIEKSITVSRAEFKEWLDNPMTKAIQKMMRLDRDDCINNLISDTMMANPSYPLLAAKWVAMITVYENFLGISYDKVRADGYAAEEAEELVE